jgi:hypothetical protein
MPAMLAAGFSMEGEPRVADVPIRLFFPKVRGAIRTRNVNPDWGFTELDPRTFQIHPNEPGGPAAEVCWPSITLKGESRFSAEVSLGHHQSQPVWLEMRIERAFDGLVCVAERMELADVSDWHHCELTFPPLGGGQYDIVLSTQMAKVATTSDFAWARFRDAQLR